MNVTFSNYGLGVIGLAAAAVGLKSRLELSKARHRSLAGHERIARFVASLVPFYQYDETQIFSADAAPDVVVAQRRADFARLADLYRKRYAATLRLTVEATDLISDLQFTEAYRVPFQFSRQVRRQLPVGAFLQSSSGVTTTDLDGNSFYDLTGCYGVNLFGYDFYKECIDRGLERVRALGPVLGSIIRWSPTMPRGWCACRAWTRFRFTCPEQRPSCRRSGSRATIRGVPTWCASAAPITAGGATSSRGSAIRCHRTKHTP